MSRLNIKSLNRQARAARRGEQYVPGCTGKTPYASAEDAIAARDRARRKTGRRFVAYYCQSCKRWHLSRHKTRS